LELLRGALISTKRVLKGDWIKVKVKSDPCKAKGLLWSKLSEKPLASASHYMTLAMSSSKGIADGT
jgi:hypothetical protein